MAKVEESTSMMQPCRVLAVALILGFLPAAACTKMGAVEGKGAQKPIQAKLVPVELRRIQRPVESVGSLFPFEEVTVSSEVEGRVERVWVDVGDRVVRQQPLVRVSPVELQLAREQQRAALEQTRAQLGVTGGSHTFPDARDAAEVKRAAADLTDAEQKYRRARSLFDEGLIARGTFDEAQARYEAARAAYDMAVQSVDNLRAEMAQRQATLALAEKKLADAIIRAPFAGQVKTRMVTAGQFLRVQTPVMTIVDNDPLRVRLNVPEKVAGSISVGATVKISVESFPGRVFEGKVSRLSPAVDSQTRSLEVEALLDNHDGLLTPGFFVKAQVASSEVVEALFVPYDAVRYVYGVYKVYAVDGHNLREKEVRLGERAGPAVEILSGLTPDERVALPPPGQELVDGLPVEAVQ